MSVFDELRETMRLLADHNEPALRSVRMHPDDYAELEKVARLACTYPSDRPGLPLGCIGYDGVLIFVDEYVARGKPWYDPPLRALRPTSAPSKGEP